MNARKPSYKFSYSLPSDVKEKLENAALSECVSESAIVEVALLKLFTSVPSSDLGTKVRAAYLELRSNDGDSPSDAASHLAHARKTPSQTRGDVADV